jgi:GT2 family glycosyltransferase
VDLSVLIPTRLRPEALARCVSALSSQNGLAFEVLVGVDGPDGGTSTRAARNAWAGPAARLRISRFPRLGLPGVRNRLIDEAQAPLILFLNDDVVPRPGCLLAHVQAHRMLRTRRHAALVVGGSPWKVHPDDTLFDRLIRDTSMIFFHDRMKGGSRRRWGFRHAFALNLSGPTEIFHRVRFLDVGPLYGHDDIEFAFRAALPIVYRPRARVIHHHRLSPGDYLRREMALGHSAVAYARANPGFALAVYGRDILDADAARRSLRHLSPLARARFAWFMRLACRAPDASPATIGRLYRRHLPLKRWAWHVGLLSALMPR